MSSNVNVSVSVFFSIGKKSAVFEKKSGVFEKMSGVFGGVVRDCVCDCDASRVQNLSSALPVLVRLQAGNLLEKVAFAKEACHLAYSFWNLRAISNGFAWNFA